MKFSCVKAIPLYIMGRPNKGERMPTDAGRDGEVADFLRGDPPAVGAVCDAVDLAVRSFQFADPALNKDLAQEALTRIFANLTSGRFRGESTLKTYASRVARYTCLEHLRRKRLEVELDAESVPSRERWSEPEQSFLGTEEHRKNIEILSSLPRDCRELMRMVLVEKLSYREIGLKLGISESAIKTRVHRCRAACRRSAGLSKPIPARRLDRRVEP